MAIAEAFLTVAASAYLLTTSKSRVVRAVSAVVLALYALAATMLLVWMLGAE